jgi:hypothetical protein
MSRAFRVAAVEFFVFNLKRNTEWHFPHLLVLPQANLSLRKTSAARRSSRALPRGAGCLHSRPKHQGLQASLPEFNQSFGPNLANAIVDGVV